MSKRARSRASARPAPLVSWRAGVHVLGTRLWCDAPRAHDLCFVSSAEAVRRRRLDRVGTLLCTERTLRLRQALGEPVPAPESLLLSPVGRPFHLGSLRLELFPSGAGAGAASLWLRLPTGETLVYAGAPCAAELPGSEPMQLRAAETLVCAAPLAACPGALPAPAEALAQLGDRVDAGRAADAVVVILCAPLCGGPLLWQALAPHRAALSVHPEIARALLAVRALAPARPGAEDAPPPRRYGRPLGPGAVLLWPAGVALPPLPRLQGAGARAVHVVLGIGAALSPAVVAHVAAALPAGAHFAGAVPLADGLDEPALRRYIAESEARTVYLTAGYSDALAAALQPAGVTLLPLGPPRQLPLFGARSTPDSLPAP